MDDVYIRHAFAWDCPTCGAENFQSLVSGPPMVSDPLADSAPEQLQPMLVPEEVECLSCKTMCRTVLADEIPEIE